MSWSFQQNKLSPSDMIKAADEYFSQPHIATMAQPEHDIAVGVRIQIVKAATAMPEGWLMNVNAYGSASVDFDRPNNSRNSLSVTIGYEAVEKPADAADAPQEAAGEPQEAAGEPQEAAGEPQEAAGEPAPTTDKPNKRKSG